MDRLHISAIAGQNRCELGGHREGRICYPHDIVSHLGWIGGERPAVSVLHEEAASEGLDAVAVAAPPARPFTTTSGAAVQIPKWMAASAAKQTVCKHTAVGMLTQWWPSLFAGVSVKGEWMIQVSTRSAATPLSKRAPRLGASPGYIQIPMFFAVVMIHATFATFIERAAPHEPTIPLRLHLVCR